MTKQKFIIEIKRTVDGFEAIADGNQLDFERVAKIVDLVKDEIEQALAGNQNTLERRKFIAYNDTLKGTDQYLGVGKLAQKFGVSTGTISVDRKVIQEKGIVGEAPADNLSEPAKDETLSSESTPESEKTSKSKKGKKGKK